MSEEPLKQHRYEVVFEHITGVDAHRVLRVVYGSERLVLHIVATPSTPDPGAVLTKHPDTVRRYPGHAGHPFEPAITVNCVGAKHTSLGLEEEGPDADVFYSWRTELKKTKRSWERVLDAREDGMVVDVVTFEPKR